MIGCWNTHTYDLAFEGIKEKSCAKYKKAWKQFQDNHGEAFEEFETRIQTEEEFLSYYLQNDEGYSSLTMWTQELSKIMKKLFRCSGFNSHVVLYSCIQLIV